MIMNVPALVDVLAGKVAVYLALMDRVTQIQAVIPFQQVMVAPFEQQPYEFRATGTVTASAVGVFLHREGKDMSLLAYTKLRVPRPLHAGDILTVSYKLTIDSDTVEFLNDLGMCSGQLPEAEKETMPDGIKRVIEL